MRAPEVDYRIPTSDTGPRVQEYPEGDGEGMDATKYAQYTRALWDEQNEALRPLHETWYENLLFLAHKQWFKNRNGQFLPDVVPDWREQPVTNICLPFFKTFLAKATKVRPAWQVIPASPDPMDTHAAQLAEEVLEAKWTELKLGRAIRRAVGWTIVTGNAYLYPYWNTSTGRMRRLEVEMDVPVYEEVDGRKIETGTEVLLVPLDEDGEPKLGEDGRPAPGAEPHVVDEGDIGVRVYSPFQVRVNPEAESDEDVTWFLIGEVMTLREIQQAWPEAFDEEAEANVMAEDVGAMDDYSHVFSNVMGGNQRAASPQNTRDKDLPKALVLFYHEMPTPEYPNGRYWVCTKDTLLEKPGDLPEGVWPSLIHLRDVDMPGRYHAASTFENIVELNREYNELNGQIKEHHNLFIRGKWLVPKGSGIRKGQITTQPGEVIQYNPGFPPTQMDLKALPSAVYNERGRVLEDYQTVGGIHKVSMGAPPPGVTAGVAFLQLQEADDTDLGPFLSMLEECIAQLASAELQIIKERYTEERLIYITGPQRKFQVRAFRGADLEGAVDVIPVAESSFPWSKTAKQSMLLTLAQQMPQLFADPETGMFDRAKFARMLPIGGLDQFADQDELDVQEAQNEEDLFANYGIEGRQVPEVAWWQDHEVHFNQHVRILKSNRHLEWPEEAQALFLQHVQETMEARDQKRAQRNIEEGGTPPGEQTPPGPGAPPDQLMEQMEEGGEFPTDPAMDEMMNTGLSPDPAAGEQRKMLSNLARMRG